MFCDVSVICATCEIVCYSAAYVYPPLSACSVAIPVKSERRSWTAEGKLAKILHIDCLYVFYAEISLSNLCMALLKR